MKEAFSGDRLFESDKEYCVIITLDVKNVFNSAVWNTTLAVHDERGVSEYLMELTMDYFKDRVLLYNTDESRKSYAVTAGIPQGLVLSPMLWNVMYDGFVAGRNTMGLHV